jgi:hypothetical protein
MFLLSTTRLAKSSTNFVCILSPFGNELVKHNLREAWDAMHEIKIRVLHMVYKHVFEQLHSPILPRLAESRVSLHNETNKDSRRVLCQMLTYATKYSICTSE